MQIEKLGRGKHSGDTWCFTRDDHRACVFPSDERIKELAREILGNTRSGLSRFVRIDTRERDFLLLDIRQNTPQELIIAFAQTLETEIRVLPRTQG